MHKEEISKLWYTTKTFVNHRPQNRKTYSRVNRFRETCFPL